MTEVSKAAERLREYGTENIPCDRPIHVLLCEVAGWALPLLDETEITEQWLESVGFKWKAPAAAWYFAHRRLIIAVRTNGQWWLEFDATYCGKVGTYNRMKTRGQLRLAVVSLGITLTEPA